MWKMRLKLLHLLARRWKGIKDASWGQNTSLQPSKCRTITLWYVMLELLTQLSSPGWRLLQAVKESAYYLEESLNFQIVGVRSFPYNAWPWTCDSCSSCSRAGYLIIMHKFRHTWKRKVTIDYQVMDAKAEPSLQEGSGAEAEDSKGKSLFHALQNCLSLRDTLMSSLWACVYDLLTQLR